MHPQVLVALFQTNPGLQVQFEYGKYTNIWEPLTVLQSKHVLVGKVMNPSP